MQGCDPSADLSADTRGVLQAHPGPKSSRILPLVCHKAQNPMGLGTDVPNSKKVFHPSDLSLTKRWGVLAPGRPNRSGHERKTTHMFCKTRITLIGFLGHDAESRSTPNGTVFTRLSLATSMSWKEKGSNEYKTGTEWHRILCWNKLGDWAGTLQKRAYVEIEGELRYRDYTPAESDGSVRAAEIHAHSILALGRSDRQPVSATESEAADEPLD
jgi:single-strand DNA-binding protein